MSGCSAWIVNTPGRTVRHKCILIGLKLSCITILYLNRASSSTPHSSSHCFLIHSISITESLQNNKKGLEIDQFCITLADYISICPAKWLAVIFYIFFNFVLEIFVIAVIMLFILCDALCETFAVPSGRWKTSSNQCEFKTLFICTKMLCENVWDFWNVWHYWLTSMGSIRDLFCNCVWMSHHALLGWHQAVPIAFWWYAAERLHFIRGFSVKQTVQRQLWCAMGLCALLFLPRQMLLTHGIIPINHRGKRRRGLLGRHDSAVEQRNKIVGKKKDYDL